MRELKPCPFCGSDEVNNTTQPEPNGCYVCPGCGGCGPLGDTHLVAKDEWNTRAQPPPADEPAAVTDEQLWNLYYSVDSAECVKEEESYSFFIFKAGYRAALQENRGKIVWRTDGREAFRVSAADSGQESSSE